MSDTQPRPPFAMQFAPAPSDPNQAHLQAVMQAAMAGGAPRFYANAIAVAITPADVILTVICNGLPVCVLNLALPTAKGIGEDLLVAVKDYERTSGETVQSLGHIATEMQRSRGEAGGSTA